MTLEDKSYTVPVINGALDSVEVYAAESQTVIKNEHTDGIEVRVICDRFLYAPIAKGERVGYLVYSCNGREIARSELISRSDVNKIKNKTIIERIFSFIFQD